jgi:hypothetical protein
MNALKSWFQEGWAGWNRFWFTPQDPATLGLIRILGGAMLFYTHLVWGRGLEAFFGPNSWVSPSVASELHGSPLVWSHFWWSGSMPLLWSIHVLALAVFALLTVGLFSRIMAILSALITLSYIHRVPGALFGLDQINTVLALYLAVGPCGDAFSLGRWLARRSSGIAATSEPRVSTNIALRLIQLHMCVIYMYAGMSKLQGITWWNGTAMWGAVANQEYQSIDMTWLVHYPLLVSLMTHVTLFWEVYYCALVWPKWTRPVTLVLAVPLHLGIAAFLGMITFGLAMLIGNLAFVPAEWIRALLRVSKRADNPARVARASGAGHARTPHRRANFSKNAGAA